MVVVGVVDLLYAGYYIMNHTVVLVFGYSGPQRIFFLAGVLNQPSNEFEMRHGR